MKPRRTHNSNQVYRLEGGTEDNDLWVEIAVDADKQKVVKSVWEPTPEERNQIWQGSNIELVMWGERVPPVLMRLNDGPLGKAPNEPK